MKSLEKKIEGNSSPFSYENIKIFCEFSEKCMCKIIILKDDIKDFGSGFFCKFNIKEFSFIQRPFLVTCNYVIDDNYLNSRNELIIEVNKKQKILDLRNRITLTDPERDFTIIEIKKFDKIRNFFIVSPKIMEDNFKTQIIGKDLMLPQFPLGKVLSLGLGSLIDIDDTNITHTISTDKGSSGSPIISANDFGIIGIHQCSLKEENVNMGAFIKSILFFIEQKRNEKNYNMTEEKPNNIAELELIKTIENDHTFFTEIILLKDGRLCSMDLDENIKIYNQNYFYIEIEIINNNPIDDCEKEKENSYRDNYKLACTKDNELIFIANGTLNIAIILNAREYQIIQKFLLKQKNHDFYIKLFILDNKIYCANLTCQEDFNCLVLEKKGNEYKQIEDTHEVLSYIEKFKYKDLEFEIGNLNNRGYMSYDSHLYHGHLHRNQKILIEPSFLIIGDNENLFNLDLEEKNYSPLNLICTEVFQNSVFKGNENVYCRDKKKAYENLTNSSFIYLSEDTYLYQIISGEKNVYLILKLVKKEKILRENFL